MEAHEYEAPDTRKSGAERGHTHGWIGIVHLSLKWSDRKHGAMLERYLYTPLPSSPVILGVLILMCLILRVDYTSHELSKACLFRIGEAAEDECPAYEHLRRAVDFPVNQGTQHVIYLRAVR